jgi:predicted RNA-binding protein associated with RNAse of E/G family
MKLTDELRDVYRLKEITKESYDLLMPIAKELEEELRELRTIPMTITYIKLKKEQEALKLALSRKIKVKFDGEWVIYNHFQNGEHEIQIPLLDWYNYHKEVI